MQNKLIYTGVLALLLCTKAGAQDRHFSQYAEMSSVINPALAGIMYDTRIVGGYRTQWGTVAKAYTHYGIAFERAIKNKKLKKKYFAVAGSIFREASGDAKLTNLNPNLGLCFAYKLNKLTKVSGGLQGGFVYRTIDVTTLSWDRQFNGYEYDPSRPSGESTTPRSSISTYDIGGGMNLSYAQSEKFISSKDGNKLNVGWSVYHFAKTNNSFFNTTEKLMPRVCAYASGDVNIPRTKNAIVPSFIMMKQGPNFEFIGGALFKFILSDQSIRTNIKKPSAFAIGVQYRFRDAIIPAILWQYDKYALGISYDINVSALTPASNRYGGVEVMLRYNTSPGYGKSLGRPNSKASY